MTGSLLALDLVTKTVLFFELSAIHYNSASRGLAVATSEQIALLPLKNRLV